MGLTTRRAALAGVGALAAGTVAAVVLRRKPEPEIHAPADAAGGGGAEPHVRLQDAEALVALDPPAPVAAFGFVDASGARREIASFAGRGVVVNLWATWCVPCVAELPALAAMAARLGPDGIAVLPLSSDRGGAAVVEKFFRAHNLTGLDIWLDPNGAAAQALGARGLPTTIVIDRQGRERARLEGAADWAAPAMLARLRQLAA